jgi:hypothetical protein
MFLTATGLVSAQTAPMLGLNLFAGVNIAGATGSVYALQSTASLAQTNSWRTAASAARLFQNVNHPEADLSFRVVLACP